jgi:hypothetical protein
MLVQQINTLFDEIKRNKGFRSDRELAQHLAEECGEPVTEMAVWRWRKGRLPKGLDVLGPQLIAYADTLKRPAA